MVIAVDVISRAVRWRFINIPLKLKQVYLLWPAARESSD
jgi:hypothetical protein